MSRLVHFHLCKTSECPLVYAAVQMSGLCVQGVSMPRISISIGNPLKIVFTQS